MSGKGSCYLKGEGLGYSVATVMTHTYCYHITNGATRSALIGGTVSADSMEEAAQKAAKLARLHVHTETDEMGFVSRYWVSDEGAKRYVYVLHNTKAI